MQVIIWDRFYRYFILTAGQIARIFLCVALLTSVAQYYEINAKKEIY